MIHKEKLDSLCHINSGGTPSRGVAEYYGGKIPWAKIGDIEKSNGVIYSTEEYITEAGLESIGNKIFPKDTLLFAMYGSVGKVAFCGIELSTNQAILGIRLKQEAKEKLDLEYLKYWFQFNLFFFKNRAVGGILKNLSATIVRDFDIPLLSITDQRRIAKILSKCEDLIQKRKESIDVLDDLLRSTFLEMFGDEFKKASEWKTKLIDVAPSIDSGWSPVCESFPRNSDDQWAVLKLSCVTRKNFDPTKNKACLPNTFIKKALIPKKGDLLFSRKNTFELVGATAYVFDNYQNLILPDTIFKINYNPQKVNGIFLWYLLNDEGFSKKVRDLANGAAGSMPNISQAKLLNLAIPNPPISLQNKFAELVEKVLNIKVHFIDSYKELENLYGSISQRAFNGELDLSKIDISDMEDSKKKDLEEVKENLSEEQIEHSIRSFEHTLPTGEVPANREVDIRSMTIRQYLGLRERDEATEGVEFAHMNKDFFYQFILKDGFTDGFLTIQDVEQYARKYILNGTGFEFTYDNWKTIIFRFIEAKQPLIEQIFDGETKTIKLKLTNEAFKV